MRRKCRRYSCRGSTDNWYNRNDGCSAGLITGAMTGVFRAPCAIHDICYATPGRTQLQCDIDFRTNMLKNCAMPGIGSIGYPFCALTAAAAYRAVRNHGHNFPGFARSCVEV
ncbi:hypothetical protein FSP39_002833 [Pinctada imbricata]|uniref:Uncharacterized protein n=1 Tax=Pinctada imbricata TaxID=66713 RepID=A0AA89BIM1_PINIB|nr:hypothetical protein FSP39_002833 [Pinctada imbricata]